MSQSSECSHHTPATGGEERESKSQSSDALTTHQLQVERRESKSQSSVCSHHTPATGGEERESLSQSSECSHHTPATGGEEESHRANQVDGDY